MASTGIINGIDVGRLNETMAMIEKDPDIANFRFRASNKWDRGGHSKTVIHDFFGAKQDVEHKHDFVIEADEPNLLLGSDLGANSVELVLSALASCMDTTLVYHAAARGIEIRSIESEIEGELDLRGFLGMSDEVRNGYKSIHINMKIDADASQEKLDELVTLARKLSPLVDILSNPVEVIVKGEPLRKVSH